MAKLRFLAIALLLQAKLVRGVRRKQSDEAVSMRADDAKIDLESDSNMSILAPARTPKGCRCKYPPKTSFSDWYGCEWCHTEGRCGKWSWVGYWDRCIFPVENTYEAQDHSTKRNMLWNRVMGTSGRSARTLSLFGTLTAIIRTSMRTAFDNHRDVLPPGRAKVIHNQGVHCKFDLVVSSASPYTGMLGPGTHQGIIRMGNALAIDKMPMRDKRMFPGIAVKFLRSGVESANFVALRGSGQGGSFNFFDSYLSNHVAPPTELTLLRKFRQASACAPMVGLSDVCSRSQDGRLVYKPKFPFEIRFHRAGQNFPDNSSLTDAGLLQQLQSIPSGTVLYKVYALDSPATSRETLIGELKTTSACVTSTFGDKGMSFRHQRMEDDFKLRPDWVRHVKFDGCDATAVSKARGSTRKWKCPGAP
eukprot:TRINITY_DN4615_c0_g1_i1.p1 TRINITY_DN4615_c0_g1~~TRINITY_DN4615_c0_g1_i1.p1  ORF type:complete len:418 (-),score=33.55 TRINITY_DN4615_c0_g1_i1:102-1355(-)